MRHVWTVLCSKMATDSETNNVSLFEVLESVQFTTSTPLQFPATVPFDARLVTLWARDNLAVPCVGEVHMRILNPQGVELAHIDNPVDLTRHPRVRTQTVLNGLPVTGDGQYEFEVAWRADARDEWHVVAKLPFEVEIRVQGEAAH